MRRTAHQLTNQSDVRAKGGKNCPNMFILRIIFIAPRISYIFNGWIDKFISIYGVTTAQKVKLKI